MIFKTASFCLFIIMLYLSVETTAERINSRSSSGNNAASGIPGTGGSHRMLSSPHFSRFGPRFSDGFLVRDDDLIELTKKQFDDYGHMRFGKREDQFDDYGHLRFGRADTD